LRLAHRADDVAGVQRAVGDAPLAAACRLVDAAAERCVAVEQAASSAQAMTGVTRARRGYASPNGRHCLRGGALAAQESVTPEAKQGAGVVDAGAQAFELGLAGHRASPHAIVKVPRTR
jgi:hypothetical protein